MSVRPSPPGVMRKPVIIKFVTEMGVSRVEIYQRLHEQGFACVQLDGEGRVIPVAGLITVLSNGDL